MRTLGQKGFGLVEVMLAAAMAGGLALTVAKISQDASRVSKTTESNTEINAFVTDVGFILSSKDNCNSTIVTPATIGTAVPAIKRYAGTPPSLRTVYEVNPGGANPVKYGNGTFSIKSMRTEKDTTGSIYLVATITKESKVVMGGKEIIKRIPLKATLDSADPNKISSCFTDTDSLIEDAAKAACHGNSARWDDVTKECYHDVDITPCPTGQVMKGLQLASGAIQKVCVNVMTSLSCPAGSYLSGFNSLGNGTCTPLSTANANCTTGQYARRLSNGNLECVSIPICTGQSFLRTFPNGELTCATIGCNTLNEYFAGFNASGIAICKAFPARDCGAGQYIKEVRADGTVICESVPPNVGMAKSDYNFIDGFDTMTNTWSRKSINDIAAQICTKFSGYNWNGSYCVPPVASSSGYTKAEMDALLALYPKMTDFHNVYSKPANLKIDPAIMHGDYARGSSYGNPIWASQFISPLVNTAGAINYTENCLAPNSSITHPRRFAVIAIGWARRDAGGYDMIRYKIQKQVGSSGYVDTGAQMEVMMNADVWHPITIFHIETVPANTSVWFRLSSANIGGAAHHQVDRSQMLCFPVP